MVLLDLACFHGPPSSLTIVDWIEFFWFIEFLQIFRLIFDQSTVLFPFDNTTRGFLLVLRDIFASFWLVFFSIFFRPEHGPRLNE